MIGTTKHKTPVGKWWRSKEVWLRDFGNWSVTFERKESLMVSNNEVEIEKARGNHAMKRPYTLKYVQSCSEKYITREISDGVRTDSGMQICRILNTVW